MHRGLEPTATGSWQSIGGSDDPQLTPDTTRKSVRLCPVLRRGVEQIAETNLDIAESLLLEVFVRARSRRRIFSK